MVLDWAYLASCGADPELLFATGSQQNQVKRVCSGCRVRLSCLAEALDERHENGVWGGMTERERRALLRRYPRVRNWRRLFDAAQEGATGRARAAAQARAATEAGAAR
jgi:WhiB family transcriptional regulator, redox-sensing transcriptional regulator